MDYKGKLVLNPHCFNFELEPDDEKELNDMLKGEWLNDQIDKSFENMDLSDIGMILWNSTDYTEVTAALHRLENYATAEKQNRLFTLPVALGDTFYGFDAEIQRIYKLQVSEIDFTTDGIYLKNCEYGPMVNLANLGKTLFRTKSEAIEKLVEALNDEKTENDA